MTEPSSVSPSGSTSFVRIVNASSVGVGQGSSTVVMAWCDILYVRSEKERTWIQTTHGTLKSSGALADGVDALSPLGLSVSSASALPALRGRSDSALVAPTTILAPLPAELPATAEEARQVARRMAGARLILGDSATERALRAALSTSPVVHVASHGALNRENPMFSSIRLATSRRSPASSDDNGRLETYEVLSSPVRSHLVFLSGCETGLGDAWSNTFARGEDYATLAQAFLFAGAHNVVATLWRINDRAAAAFAEKFYEQISNAPLADALAAAQRAFLASREYAAPFYWAGYALSGSGRLGSSILTDRSASTERTEGSRLGAAPSAEFDELLEIRARHGVEPDR